ncbi:hypothetical protein [Pseudoalteromonas marina]|uniref:Uncharacterized protein n=1 Tax=Pseudoalteromonas marina TaxID=267375 RepID=A0ABT9FI06_9GAMM|nr:hypothetical protein [Pseudoalteromonas marina]MDP2566415.1 hypothetical protein [Pseudoalteromonas marina]
MSYEVYLNRRSMGKSKKRIYSLRGATTGAWKGVVRWLSPTVVLKDVSLVVNPAGRLETISRMNNEHKISRTVHAFLRGKLIRRGRNAKAYFQELLSEHGYDCKSVGYDPQKTDSWVALSEEKDIAKSTDKVVQAKYAFLHQDGIEVIL